MSTQKVRMQNTLNDLLELDAKCYCDLGPGYGELPIALHKAGKEAIFVESEWNEYLIKDWPTDHEFKYYIKDFLIDKFTDYMEEPVDCFSLVHVVAHFHLPPHLLLKMAYDKLPEGGFFYLSTVNGSSLTRVMKLFRGQPITGKVTGEPAPQNETNVYLSRILGIDKHMTYSDWMHVKEYTKPELEQIFKDCGFKIYKSFWRNNFKHWKQNLASKFRPSLSEEIIIIGQK